MLLLQKAFYIPDRYSRVYTEGGNKRLLESARCNLIFRVISVIMKKIKVEIDDAENRMNHPAWMIQIVQIPRAKRL